MGRVEGAVGDWSALYLFEDKGIVIEEAVMGVMLFNGTMCIGRLLGNTIGKHLTSKQVVVGGYLLGAIAMGLIVFLPGYGSMYTYLLLGISYAGGTTLQAIRKVDYVLVKNSIFNGDR